MAAAKQHSSLLWTRLKKQVRNLQRKEEKSRDKLRKALKKIKILGRVSELKRQMLKKIESKTNALNTAVLRLEKVYLLQSKNNIGKQKAKRPATKKHGKRRAKKR